jgi:cytochrome b561
MAVLILAMLFIGVSMVSDLSTRHPLMVELHKATGLALLVLVILRICLRLSLPHPPLPRDLPAIQRWPPAPRTCCCTP